MLFGNLFRNPPQPELPVYGYLDEKGHPLAVRGIGIGRKLLVLFPSYARARQALHSKLPPTIRVIELATVAGLAAHLRHSGAKLLSFDADPLASEAFCYSHRRTDCPVGIADALAALENPPPPAAQSPHAMLAPPARRAAPQLS